MISELSKLLDNVTVAADWVGFRAVSEQRNIRSMRDAIPTQNGRSLSQGLMVEVLARGQLGYAAVNRMDRESVHQAVEKAYQQAIAASEWGIHTLTPAVRPKVVGQFISPSMQALDALNPADVNDILMRLCKTLKVSDQVVQTMATAITTNLETWFVSSNGSQAHQHFRLMETHYGATAQDGASYSSAAITAF